MIQFNLLPDVKLAYIKAQRVRGLAITISVIVTAVSVGLMLIAVTTVYGIQKKQLNDTTKEIASKSNELKNTKDIDKILTIQNQLNTIAGLQEKKPLSTRIFAYVTQLTPAKAQISSLSLDYATNVINIAGTADSTETINKYADALKYTTYTTEGDSKSLPAFKTGSVVTVINRSELSAGYTLTAIFDPILFDITKKVSLVVPSEVTTRSVTEKPNDLFNDAKTNNQVQSGGTN